MEKNYRFVYINHKRHLDIIHDGKVVTRIRAFELVYDHKMIVGAVDNKLDEKAKELEKQGYTRIYSELEKDLAKMTLDEKVAYANSLKGKNYHK